MSQLPTTLDSFKPDTHRRTHRYRKGGCPRSRLDARPTILAIAFPLSGTRGVGPVSAGAHSVPDPIRRLLVRPTRADIVVLTDIRPIKEDTIHGVSGAVVFNQEVNQEGTLSIKVAGRTVKIPALVCTQQHLPHRT
jgi:hypothetical protein